MLHSFGQLERIISGGQTGVDRAALDIALELGIPHGGWCPLGRLAEDGFIPTRYALRQMNTSHYSLRTERNVVDSSGTFILYQQELSGGTELTLKFCQLHGKPYCVYDLSKTWQYENVLTWLEKWEVKILNVAGPRESTTPGIGERARQFLRTLLQRLQAGKSHSLFGQFEKAERKQVP